MDLRLSLAGLIVGIFVGLSGVGGSAILAPVLILLLGVKPTLVIGTDLLYSVPTKIFAAVLHFRQGTIDWAVTRMLLAGGVPGAIGGIVIFGVLRAHLPVDVFETALRHGIGVAILLASAGSLLLIFRPRLPQTESTNALPERPVAVAAIGALVGVLVALTSVGSGSITLPLLILTLPAIAMRRLIGSEIAFAAFLVPVAAVGQGAFGNVSWAMAGALLLGSIPGVWIGAKLCSWLGDAWLRPAIVIVLAFAGSRLL
jgi:uncharacterized membrane protein YfcA